MLWLDLLLKEVKSNSICLMVLDIDFLTPEEDFGLKQDCYSMESFISWLVFG